MTTDGRQIIIDAYRAQWESRRELQKLTPCNGSSVEMCVLRDKLLDQIWSVISNLGQLIDMADGALPDG